ncbi:hypothetical protein CORC01_01726 [Colletotrichum orchidophilum]|uniref:CorA-like Mg2+ transporter n=1 Tax=Colletotrichum orchidophilum TaxID=1209926 RepID=A0A1G4BNT0_9PEZI|nr:uncharacterized protein CORC01_01726 [Colletotrichum orchidophilum]OHF02968.1 hypothetical protein CORC01_01726 [Colletotrichum orchidophilum]
MNEKSNPAAVRPNHQSQNDADLLDSYHEASVSPEHSTTHGVFQHDANDGALIGETNSARSITNKPGDIAPDFTGNLDDPHNSTTSNAYIGYSDVDSGLSILELNTTDQTNISIIPNQSGVVRFAKAQEPEHRQYHSIALRPPDGEGNPVKIDNQSGPTAIFLLRVTEILKTDESFRDKLATTFAMDSFFLTNTAYDSNGFFLEKTSQETSKAPATAYGCRFLVKELSLVPDPDKLEKIQDFLEDQIEKLKPRLEIPPLPRQKPEPTAETWSNPTGFRDALDFWLRTELERVVWARQNQQGQHEDERPSRKDLYQLITAILHRSYHDLGCIGEVEKGQIIKSSTTQVAKVSDVKGKNEAPEMPSSMWRRTIGPIRDRNAPPLDAEKGRLPVHTEPGITPSKKARPSKRNYHWLFLSFWTVFLRPNEDATVNGRSSTQSKEVIPCFDNASGSRMKERMKAILLEQYPRSILPQVIEEIVHMYDDALWGFRTPVRDLRGQHVPERNPIKDDAREKDESVRRRQNYFDMHGLSRHLIHSQETLSAAETTLKANLDSKQPELVAKRAGEISRFSELFIKNLKFRAGSFVERLNNETFLALHINNLKQLEKVEELLIENKMDGKDVTKAVGYASVLFLPGTFISGFFSMPFFDYQESSWPNASQVWIWVAVALPMTTVAFLWLYWSRTRSQHSVSTMSARKRSI